MPVSGLICQSELALFVYRFHQMVFLLNDVLDMLLDKQATSYYYDCGLGAASIP